MSTRLYSPKASVSAQKTKVAATGGDIDINIVRKTNDYAKMQPWFR